MSYRAAGINKHFGGVHALRDVSIEFHPGSVHALLGENGAGKSTLLGVLGGALRPDAGNVTLDGKHVTFKDAREAAKLGVATVAQELRLYPELSALDNLFSNNERTRAGFLSRGKMRQQVSSVVEELGLSFDLDTPVVQLSLGDRQLIEIGRALLLEPRVLILDEPTSALGPEDVQRLLEVVRDLAGRGVAICYVSHMLDEVMQVCDTVTVLRNGQNVWVNEPMEGKDPRMLVRAMIGSDIEHVAVGPADHPTLHRAHTQMISPGGALKFEDVSAGDSLRDVTLTVAPGEIVGLAGRPGAGHQTVLELAFGMAKASSGNVTLPDGLTPTSIRHAVRHGVALVPGDRRRLGLMLDNSIADNVSAVTRDALGEGSFFISRRDLTERAIKMSEQVGIVSSGPAQLAGQLSGGNQQKVVFAKWLTTDPDLLLLDDPTRGVDIGARAEMHDIVRGLAADGTAVAVTSTDVPELVELCTRIIVFYHGRVRAMLASDEMTVENVLYAMSTAPGSDAVDAT